MDRRTFAKAGACVAASVLSSTRLIAGEGSASRGELVASPFRSSVMLWTIFRDSGDAVAQLRTAGRLAVEATGGSSPNLRRPSD